ncbi:MAG TPA: efflux RND transporter periplasmic adaptor subunit [Nitrospiraceae bacterium]|nr:efflux RND transporter periplasmic adaptor subunit [Nitrospiraceae bacterium]HCL80770.1 efflux RND transporter periplasmic adaptor subunit [Nitrospiraceae bacterium]HCZ12195.1 efflux RND transporter periplasmic adaptor subunit [Nitrospiraceae bacterium]
MKQNTEGRSQRPPAGSRPALCRSIFSIVTRCCVWIACVLLVTACSDTKSKQEKPKAVPVLVASAVQKDVPVQVTAIGNVEAYSTAAVNARVGGQLQRIHFKEGQDVKKGDILFTIDPRPFEAALRQAEATTARDTAQMENARLQARRYEELVKKGYVAQADYDQMRTNADALEAVVRADKAAVENAQLQLSYCYIYAPITGRTGNLTVNQGNLIKADDKAIVTINQIQPIYAAFSMPEQNLPEIRKYAAGGKRIKVSALPQNEGLQVQGELAFIDNAVDTATGTIRLKAIFENRDRRLWPGQFVNVVVTLTTRHDSIVIPSHAVQTGQAGQYVFVVKGDAAELRPVIAGITHEDMTVIEKGIEPDEVVVTDGHMRLMPGAKVEIKK